MLAIAAVDGAALGMPIDAIIAVYVYQHPPRLLLYVFMASAGSALGSLVIYAIGYTGGEELLRKRISPKHFEKFHGAFDKHPFWSLMFPAILPPPTPFKLFALAAGASEMRLGQYLLAIFAGRFVRFLLVSFFTLIFGPEIVHIFAGLVRTHWPWVLAAVGVGLLVWLLVRTMKRRSRNSSPQKQEALPDQSQTS